MLRGLCRGEPACPLPHGLLPHQVRVLLLFFFVLIGCCCCFDPYRLIQMPICEHYLRMKCKHGPDECGLVHIKVNFNIGNIGVR